MGSKREALLLKVIGQWLNTLDASWLWINAWDGVGICMTMTESDWKYIMWGHKPRNFQARMLPSPSYFVFVFYCTGATHFG